MPRSRLKLAVPFVGKDVPSAASEFAHPDVTIGVTVLAYRLSGLRREDFDELTDVLTAEFSREIGPARERPSSRRHELWVRAAGGSIRGLDDAGENTVVQLKFLQKSNDEQMDKLFALWRTEPLVVHHYLETLVFPTHMRSQRLKISASGQSIGGDMLFDQRVGFSGTPSDLLPFELGHCEYEQGDDGKMLATVLDETICSTEHVPQGWTVDYLLDLASGGERAHALIDTGALVTGRTNKQVAVELLKRGLPWCDGVVYLDDDDKKQVLVRATMRAMPEEQCGVPLERRFAFYDQVHTTGTDIRHVANATAIVTLGKDMVWRDYAQGCYRMRGIAAGQRIRVVVIPEVQRLIKSEVPSAGDFTPLGEIVAWLIINSLRAEQLQWSMLCAQNIGNVYRKDAFNVLMAEDVEQEIHSASSRSSPQRAPRRALQVFEEPIDFSLEATVPDPVPFEERLRALLETHSEFATRPEQQEIAATVLHQVERYTLKDKRGDGAKRLDTEQEREQEQEQEKEVRARKDQSVEVEKFVEREYSRNEEAPRPWPLRWLLERPGDEEHPFYPLSKFALRHHEGLEFPSQLLLSRNYFRREWTGLRRLKNVVMVMEWAPDGGRLRHPRDDMTDQQKLALNRAHSLFCGGSDGALDRTSLRDAVDVVEEVEKFRSDDDLDALIAEFGDGRKLVDQDGFARLVASGTLTPEHDGRYWVALSLAEAETLRRALHVRKDLVLTRRQNSTPLVALRYSPSNVVLDASGAWQKEGSGSTPSETAIAHNAFRFFDGDVHFSEPALHALVRALRRAPPRRRERFFLATIGARRRLERSPRMAPLGRAFAVDDEYALIARRAMAVFLRTSIKNRGLTCWQAFVAFDDSNTGVVTPAELYGALRYFGAAEFITADDVIDFFALAAPDDQVNDETCASMTFRAFLDALRVEEDDNDSEVTTDHLQLKVEPYGGDEVRDAVMRRRRAAIEEAASERARAAARADEVDRRTYDDELLEAERKHGKHGVNPRVMEFEDHTKTVFSFGHERRPLRCTIAADDTTKGSHRFIPLDFERVSRRPVPPLRCVCGHTLRPYDSMWERCSRCKPRDRRGVVRLCGRCYSRVCDRCVSAHERDVLKKRADPTGRPTFLRLAQGTSVTVQIPAKAFNSVKGSYAIHLEIKIDRPPTTPAALIRLGGPLTIYVDHGGRILVGSRGHTLDTARLGFNKWTVLTFNVDCETGFVSAYVQGRRATQFKVGEKDDLRLGRHLACFAGEKLADARGGSCRQIILLSHLLTDVNQSSAFAVLAENPELIHCATRIQALARARSTRSDLLTKGIPSCPCSCSCPTTTKSASEHDDVLSPGEEESGSSSESESDESGGA